MTTHVLDAVRDLLPTFRERADEAERLRVVSEASVKELQDIGFFQMLQPKRWGGLEADPIDFYTGVRDIAGACASTGWISSVLTVHPWQIALFPEEAQQAVAAARYEHPCRASPAGTRDCRQRAASGPRGRRPALPTRPAWGHR